MFDFNITKRPYTRKFTATEIISSSYQAITVYSVHLVSGVSASTCYLKGLVGGDDFEVRIDGTASKGVTINFETGQYFPNGCQFVADANISYAIVSYIVEIPSELSYSKTEQLYNIGGLTFAKDFTKTADVVADYAVGSAIGTFTRSATNDVCTYIDSNGVIRLASGTTLPRFQGGYYDATGFHAQSGLMIEAAGTNLIPKSYTMNDATWDATNVTVADGADSDPAGGTNAASLTASAGNGTVLLHTAVTAATYSVWIKRKTGTGDVVITANGGTAYSSALSLSSTEWRRFQITAASASQICGIKIVTSGDAIYVYGNQFENGPYATSLIPTTTAAKTRNKESLSYLISGNRTAATESIFFKVSPSWTLVTAVGSDRVFIGSDTKARSIKFRTSNGFVVFRPNETDSSTAESDLANSFTANSSTVVTAIAVGATGNPNSTIYKDGGSAVSNNTDWTSPAWGTNFWIGSDASQNSQFSGVIQSVAIFSDAKDATAVSNITNIINA